ncbi:hypothetical protein O181_039779 [Austropuccinia psidii MF-1]|uniref:Uncharacterized protein n=1 Tax=Austropuccinia psidii MF-1 TaxID=1389203 RepID=A0A9Q3HEV5_9BASI|nr:hypothetical protein [Austropuccinia psidii MF-1]
MQMCQFKKYYMVYKEKYWETLPQIHQGVKNSWKILKKGPQIGGNSEILQRMGSIIIQNSNKKIKDWHNKNSEESKEEDPVAYARKPQASQPPQEGKNNKEKNWRKSYTPSYRIPKIKKGCHDQKLEGIQGQRGAKNETTPFSEEKSFVS